MSSMWVYIGLAFLAAVVAIIILICTFPEEIDKYNDNGPI